jgi:formyl-CoA transferase
VKHLKMARPVRHPRLGVKEVVASPINLVGHPKDVRSPTPDAGADTVEVLRGLGYSEAELTDMKARGIV